MKKYALMSISLNLILLLIYFGIFHTRHSFKETQSIYNTLELNQKVLSHNITKQINYTSEVAQYKPKLDEIIKDEFCQNEICVNNFSKIIHKYINTELSKDELREIFKSYNNNINELKTLFIRNITNSQKEAKLTNNEIDDKINSFHLKIMSPSKFIYSDLATTSQHKRAIILLAMKTHLIQLQNQANNEFHGFIGYRGCFFYGGPYPIIFNYKNNVKKGNHFEMDIGISKHIDRKHKDYCKVILDGDILDISSFGYQSFYLEPNSIGPKKHELIFSWVNPISKEVKTDTTILKYNVTP